MKKLLVALLAITLMTSPAFATNDGGKSKARKKANIERKKDNSCDVKKCDPKICDPKNCDPKNCEFPTCTKEEKCPTAKTCSKNK